MCPSLSKIGDNLRVVNRGGTFKLADVKGYTPRMGGSDVGDEKGKTGYGVMDVKELGGRGANMVI
jgi:hypothetical protein